MDRTDFQQYADSLKDEIEDRDYKPDDILKVPILRIHQDKTQNPPENSEKGMFYSSNAGFILPARRILITILEHESIRQLWPIWAAQLKYIICRCFHAEFSKQNQGTGIVSIEEEGRWIPGGEGQRLCVQCLYNRFRNREFEPLEDLLYNGKPLSTEIHCRSGKLFGGIILPDSNEISSENVIPFILQTGASTFSNAYAGYPHSWIGLQGSLKQTKPPLPLNTLKLSVTTQEIDTPNGSTWVPMFEVVGAHTGMMPEIRVIEDVNRDRLALNSAEVSAIVDLTEVEEIEE